METYKFIRHLKRIANYGPNKGDEVDHKILDVLLFYEDFYEKGLINKCPYPCFFCKRFFPSKGSLKMHQKGKKCKENRKCFYMERTIKAWNTRPDEKIA